MNQADIAGLVEGLAPAVRDYCREQVIDPLVERIAALEARIGELERRPAGVQYRGVWAENEHYVEGCLVTLGGSLWVARTNTDARPGTGSGWQLCVKSGERR